MSVYIARASSCSRLIQRSMATRAPSRAFSSLCAVADARHFLKKRSLVAAPLPETRCKPTAQLMLHSSNKSFSNQALNRRSQAPTMKGRSARKQGALCSAVSPCRASFSKPARGFVSIFPISSSSHTQASSSLISSRFSMPLAQPSMRFPQLSKTLLENPFVMPWAVGHLRLGRSLCSSNDKEKITITFIEDGEKKVLSEEVGQTILEVAHKNEIDLEGACDGSLACSTCHVILPEDVYERLPPPSDEENDMLDLAFGLTDTSRLGCQITLDKTLDGVEIQLPSATRNMAVDGYKPKPH